MRSGRGPLPRAPGESPMASATVLASSDRDVEHGSLLGLHGGGAGLFSVLTGRPLSIPIVLVSLSLLSIFFGVFSGANRKGTTNVVLLVVSVALQCYSELGAGAWAMLEAEVLDATGGQLARFRTGSDWYSYNGSHVIRPGALDTGGYGRVNEDIDARALGSMSLWREGAV